MDVVTETSVDYRQLLNVCQCCLANGCCKDISTEYYDSGQREVYEDMLKDTFDIRISYHDNGHPDSISRLICENCITRLRDASTFKDIVKRSQEEFSKLLNNGSNIEVLPQDPLLKEEEIKDEEIIDDYTKDGGDDKAFNDGDDEAFNDGIDGENYSDDDDEILANLKQEPNWTKEENIDLPLSSLQKLLDKDTACTRKQGKTNEDTEKNRAKSNKDWLKIAERRGNGPLLRETSIKLISNSTISVFQWNKSRYRCFCCTEPFSDINLLRDHTSAVHTLEQIKKKIIMQQNRLVKVEISTLFCKICGARLESLTSLKDHLKKHGLKFESDDDLLVPFKIDSTKLQCQMCFQNFTTFRLLNIHMNKHYQKQVCHICGAGFSNLVFLNLHKSRSHRPFACKLCNIVFKNKTDKKDHDISVHKLKIERKQRFPCPYCQERFYQENFRVQHLVDKHGMNKPEYKCSVCSKVFITRSLCNNHVKKVHLKEKNNECDVCHHLFYTKSDVARHKVTHTGDKKFSCSLCNNLFSTKDSLRRHIKRSHAGAL